MTERQKQLAVARPFPEEPPNGSHCSWVDMLCDVIDSIEDTCVARDVYLSIDDPTIPIRGDEKSITCVEHLSVFFYCLARDVQKRGHVVTQVPLWSGSTINFPSTVADQGVGYAADRI